MNLQHLPQKIRRYLSPVKSSKESEYDELLNIDIISKLEYLDCILKTKIAINEDEKIYVKYIKCSLSNGSIMYVDIETDELKPNENDVIMNRTESNEISISKKYGDFHLCYPDVEGTVFEHVDSFVVIRSDKELDPYETTYIYKHDVKIERGEDRPKSYPLVNFNSLYSNFDIISRNITLCFSRLKNSEYEICRKDLSESLNIIHKIYRKINELDVKFNEVVRGYDDSNLKLSKGLLMFKDNNKLERVKYNLSVRKESTKNLCNIMSIIEVMNNKFSIIDNDLKDLLEQVQLYHNYIDYELVK